MNSISKVVETAIDQKLREEIANAISQPVTAKVLTMTRLQAILAKFSLLCGCLGPMLKVSGQAQKTHSYSFKNFPKG